MKLNPFSTQTEKQIYEAQLVRKKFYASANQIPTGTMKIKRRTVCQK